MQGHMSRSEAAARLGVSESTVLRLAKEGALNEVRIGKRAWVESASVDAMLSAARRNEAVRDASA